MLLVIMLSVLTNLSQIIESARESGDQLNVILQRTTVQSDCGEPTDIDWMISGYNPANHLMEDLERLGIGDIARQNFPYYSLKEKDSLGYNWSREEWAAARMGDLFAVQIPAEVNMELSDVSAATDNYISQYNIRMGHVVNDKGLHLWPEDMSLLTHWNLRDELKSNYAKVPNNREKQELLYQIMLHIVRQDIPAAVINSTEYEWNPVSNRTWKDYNAGKLGEEVFLERELDVRYQQVLDCFHTIQKADPYCKNNYVERRFADELEMPVEQIEALFTELISSKEVAQVAKLIRKRLGRKLRPYDIWYDGFKARSTMNEESLTAQTRSLYPTAEDYHRDMPRMLRNIGFSNEEADYLTNHIIVEPARGSGHARPCLGRNTPARLRTRIGADGMDYKGYNIAVHEMGHNVEEVISLYHMDHYMLAGIPNDGFTEASAFLFQQRDLQLLGYGKQPMDANTTLDAFWGMYEIMGVSLLDIRMWKWLYLHPEATASELREAVLNLAAEVWNEYYYPILGEKDSPLLAIYSHMICYPLYLSGYPIGHLVQFQLEEHLSKCATDEEFAREYMRIYQQGRLTPKHWMLGAVGQEISVLPVLNAVDRILSK